MTPAGRDARRSVFPGFREILDRRSRLVTELVAERHRQQLTQTELAARMGTSQSAVARLESGEADARLSTLERYADALGVVLHWELRSPPTTRRDTRTTGRSTGSTKRGA
jgi:transcriptional regulator with XRE-family HTH domain